MTFSSATGDRACRSLVEQLVVVDMLLVVGINYVRMEAPGHPVTTIAYSW